VQLDQLQHHYGSGRGTTGQSGTDGAGDTGTDGGGQGTPRPDTTRAWEALEQAIIGKTMFLLMHSTPCADLRRFHQANLP